jgi:hypothetical protein
MMMMMMMFFIIILTAVKTSNHTWINLVQWRAVVNKVSMSLQIPEFHKRQGLS